MIAVLRLLDHQRTVKSLLCYDHAFIQSASEPLALVVRQIAQHARTASSGSNPFRKEDVATTPTAQTSFDTPVSTNPFRALSRQGGRLSPIDTRNLSHNQPAPSTKLASPDGPPLPPKRRPVQPPPKRIVSESQQNTPKHSRNSSRTVYSEPSSIHSGRGPLVAPKPKLVSSTYISPSTNLRPRPPGASKANAYTSTQDSDTFSLTPSFTSSSTSSLSSTEDLRTNRPIAELVNQNTGSTDFSIRSSGLGRSNTTGTRRAPPPVPRRKEERSNSANNTPRPDWGTEWVTRAKEQVVARVGNANERASLMRDDREDEYRAALVRHRINGMRDEEERNKRQAWTPLA